MLLANVPAAQALQVVLPVDAWKRPTAQGAHAVRPVVLANVPIAQSAQLVAPWLACAFPAGQG